MTQRIKPDRPIWPTPPADTRSGSAPADTQTHPRPRNASAAS
ncbi:hypothetical protein MTDSW087_02532 [Methylobacterium dankookense]|uniref:Uncharacterized protein n=1 Tax=Methylobacterium dankookense TaxID=560405 RepID=A0A564FXX0_9HYPH|nr:hypothetical protein IFDJLNFL_5701 [Methylobacterium dankookense]VUF12837.1 hypothetical protein MTDSW087_02532 [Methylobacterium dankookense]